MQKFRPIVRWISENYPSAEKVVEVGVGRDTRVLAELGEVLPGCMLIATDVREVSVPEGVEFAQDDIAEPELRIYRGADLIFALRTPPELYPPLIDVSRKVGADLLVKPVSSEESPRWGELINYSGATFYLKSFRTEPSA